jgi:hypothetical protein
MKARRALHAAFIFVLAVNPAFPWTLPQQPARAPEAKPEAKTSVSAPRPIEVADILKWKRIQSPTPSSDGRYFAHKLVPVEGDSEVVVRRIEDGKEWRFPTGESAGPGGFGGPFGGGRGPRELAFSDDGKWFAYTVSPGFRESKRLRRERKPLQNKVVLVNLATEQKTEFEKVRRFAFSGEASTWLALHRYGPDAPGAGGAPAGAPAGPPAGGAAAAAAADRPTGSDLILH